MSAVVFFDLDGTLIDSAAAIAECINAALRANGLLEVAGYELRTAVGPPLHETFSGILRRQGASLGLVDACIGAYRKDYRTVSLKKTTLIDQVEPMLAELAGSHRLAVVTSKPGVLARPIVEALGIGRYFRAVFGPELAATTEGKTETLARAKTVLEADGGVMIGDREHDVEAAIPNGMTPIGVTWGAGSECELRRAGATVIVRRPADLPRAVLAALDAHKEAFS